MPTREQDDLPYRSPVTARQVPTPTSVDEQDFSTLKIVRGILSEAVNGLYKDFNAFDILKDQTPETAARNLLRQVEAKQIAYDTLSPLLDAVDTAMKNVDNNYKER